MTSLGDYHYLYLKTDVLLPADVFESFRTMCMRDYGRDACHYMTSLGLSWSSLLRMTKVELELIMNIEQLLMIEAGIRGDLKSQSDRPTIRIFLTVMIRANLLDIYSILTQIICMDGA